MCVPFGLFSRIIVFLLNLKKNLKIMLLSKLKRKYFYHIMIQLFLYLVDIRDQYMY